MKVESYKIKGWKNDVTGLLIAENDDWVLVKHVPVDYVIDGFKLYNKKFIQERKSNKAQKKIERVLNLKKVTINMPKEFKFGDASATLDWSEKKYGLFEFQDKSDTELFYGKVKNSEGDLLNIDMIKANGKIDYKFDYEFKLSKIRSITFESDYFESIRLLMNDENTNNTQYKP